MRVSVICVGRLSREYQAVWRHYQGLLRPYIGLEVFETAEVPLSLGEAQARTKEGTALLSLFRKGAFTVALDGRGRQYSSETWSALLAEKKVSGHSSFQFVLGGAAGLDERIVAAAHVVWSLSDLTFPHQMARCMMIEQLYRALRIERGEPYHH